MLSFQWFMFIFVALFLVFPSGSATLPRINPEKSKIICSTIYVDPSGGGNFTTIQAAIDSVPSSNQRWICIRIKQGVYREQVLIPFDKPFIYLKGAGKRKTCVVWDAHDSIATSATFTSQADNIIAKSISFINSYNYPLYGSANPMRAAVAALIQGDKSAFYRCGFFGLQDTLWDVQGRHYFRLCTIQGAVDFIFGSGQSLYEGCTISVVAGVLNGVQATSQLREDQRLRRQTDSCLKIAAYRKRNDLFGKTLERICQSFILQYIHVRYYCSSRMGSLVQRWPRGSVDL
ncbi:hypothetical protein DH2020_005154 [Rehmannia glutinosa]|uniref:Pectinesterase n=1 Tax=Rehmannia glutinosa TaxID=99300 RepID=A0ABR0XRR9_REHGL